MPGRAARDRRRDPRASRPRAFPLPRRRAPRRVRRAWRGRRVRTCRTVARRLRSVSAATGAKRVPRQHYRRPHRTSRVFRRDTLHAMPAVVIAATNLMPALRERLADEGELLTFADTEPIQALQTILEQRPRLIVLERLFAATPRGAALINRIKTDPQVAQAEIRVMSHTGDYTRVVSRGAAAAAAAIESSPSAPAHAAAEAL